MKKFLMISGIILAVVVVAFARVLIGVVIFTDRSVESSAIDRWVLSDAEDKGVYIEFVSGKEWKARFTDGKVVKGSWNYRDNKESLDEDVLIYQLADEKGTTYRMEFFWEVDERDDRLVLYFDSGEKLEFERS